MNETTFENAKVGDRVWDLRHGWGTVNSRQDNAPCPLSVWFDAGNCLGFSFDGHSYSQKRTLFWDEIKFEAPPRPARKIKKVVEGWVNVYADKSIGVILHRTIDHARGIRRDRIALGEPLFIRHEYEVEE